MLKVLELFSGIGSQIQALKNLGIEHISTQCDIDKYAVESYNQLHGETENLGDISKVNPENLYEGQWDLITYSFPCFTGDTLVMTTNGYKQIKDVQVGDNVITHTGTFKQVVSVFNNGLKDIVKIKGMGVDEIKCTPNHRFYVREKKYRYEYKGRVSKEGWKKKDKIRYFDEPKWVEAKDLTKNHFFGIPINTKELIPEWNGIDFEWSDGRKIRHKNELSKYMNNNDFWWLIGRYLGDGWCRTDGGIIICTAHNEVEEVTQVLDRLGLHYNNTVERTTTKIHIPFKEIGLFCSQFGKGALNKHLTGMIFDLPRVLLKSFVNGYLSADGYCSQAKCGKIYKATSVSRELIYGISMCIMKAYHNPVSLYKEHRPPQCIIEGKIVNQHGGYQIRFNEYKSFSDKAFYESGYIWIPFRSREDFGKDIVYDIHVETDHSFTANNVIVHNCTDVSVAGKQEGLAQGSGTRSSLLWECEKIIRKVKPKYLLMENVKNLVGKKFIAYFESWLKVLEDMGYTNYWKVLNAKDYGVPQNRERVFCVSILGEHKPYVFPEKIPLTVRLKDVLDAKVDEKYYLKNDVVEKFKYKPKEQNGIMAQIIEDFYHSRDARIYTKYAPTLRINCSGLKTVEPVIEHIGDVPLGTESMNRVYDTDGLSPTLDTMQGGHRQPKIICYDIPQTVSVRKYPVDCEKLVATLRDARDKCKLSTDVIASKLNVPQTMVAHWFRTDNCFSIPEKDIWFKLKDLLKIDTNEFDESITTFEEKDGVFEKANRCYGPNGIAPTLTATSSDEKIVEYQLLEPLICASRGRNPDNPSDRTVGAPTEQRIEVNTKGVSNTLTTVQKDNYVLEPTFRIRKLTPTECWRLMGWTDEQIHKVKNMSNAQLYKQAGNSIVVSVLEAIFRKLFLDD